MLIAPLALIAALNAGPATTAFTGAAPVRVASCTLEPQIPQPQLAGINVQYPGALAISFVNENPKTVTSVTFAVNDGNRVTQLVDNGSFSNGTAINRSYSAPGVENAPVSCSVRSVAFSDGSVWQAQ